MTILRLKKRFCVTILMLMVSTCIFSQNKVKRLYERADSILRVRYERVSYDTQYISRPDKRLLLRIRENLSGNSIRYKNIQGENDTHAHFSTSTRGTISLGASYMGLAAAFSINPAKWSGRNQDYELNVRASSNRYFLDFCYQRSNTLSGDISTVSESRFIDKGFLKMKMINLTGCFAVVNEIAGFESHLRTNYKFNSKSGERSNNH